MLPSGTITLVLADVEGSTRLWQEREAEMPEAWPASTRSSMPPSRSTTVHARSSRARATASLQPSIVRLRLDVDVASGRLELGDEAFDAAWAEGTAMTFDEAVSFAQRGRGLQRRPSTGWASLTPTKLGVVALVAERLSNLQSADRLIMSRRTVSTHLTHVFAKFGISSRAELAAPAAKQSV